MQSLGTERRCVASFGGAARKWLTGHGFVTLFDMLAADMACCHLSIFYRYECLRRPGSGVRARLRLACAARTGSRQQLTTTHCRRSHTPPAGRAIFRPPVQSCGTSVVMCTLPSSRPITTAAFSAVRVGRSRPAHPGGVGVRAWGVGWVPSAAGVAGRCPPLVCLVCSPVMRPGDSHAHTSPHARTPRCCAPRLGSRAATQHTGARIYTHTHMHIHT